MSGRGVTSGPDGRSAQYTGSVTWRVVLALLIAGSGGMMFGYDTGITGGVTSMHSWQVKFFPAVVSQQETASPYCKLDNQLLQLFTSSLYLAGAVASLCAGYLTQRFGRKNMMVASGGFYLIGAVLQCSAQELIMLIIGRVILGVGVGFAIQSAPLYLAEIAPYKWRGACNMAFQQMDTVAILVAGLVNYTATNYSVSEEGAGWRFSLGFAIIPACALFFGSMFLPDSPNSLIERGQLVEGRRVLQTIRACEDVDAEFDDIVDAARLAALTTNQWSTIIKRRYRPQLVISILLPIFQQLTGINAIMFYAPQLFSALGHDEASSLLNTVIIGCVNMSSTAFAVFLVDRIGRRALYLQGGIQMMICLIVTAVLMGVEFGAHGNVLPAAVDKAVLAMICIFIAGFAWSWGALGWLVPVEIQPLQTRSAGTAINVSLNLLATFVIGQAFLSMLCGMEYGVFLFFGGFCILMTLFVYFFVPETMGTPIEELQDIFQSHWFWGPVMGPAEELALDPVGSLAKVEVASKDLQQALQLQATAV